MFVSILLVICIAAYSGFAIYKIIQKKKNGGCCGGCGNCPASKSCHQFEDSNHKSSHKFDDSNSNHYHQNDDSSSSK